MSNQDIQALKLQVMETSRHQVIMTTIHEGIKASKYKSIKVSLYQTIKTTNNMTTIKSETIKIRVDSQTLSEIQSRADRYTNGNLSAFVRCATLQYNEKQVAERENPQMIASLNSALKLIGRIGTNSNQVIRHINEQQKMFPLSLRASDLLPFSQFHNDWTTVQDMLKYLSNLITNAR